MTEADRISDLLRRAARDGRLSPSAVAPGVPDAALARFAEAVDTAVLERRLVVQLGGVDLICAAAARRLLSIEAPNPEVLPEGAEGLVGRPLTTEDAAAVAAFLRSLAQQGGAFALSIEAPKGAPEPALGGIAAATLSGALAIKAPPPPEDPLVAGFEALGADVIAAVLVEEDAMTLLSDDPGTEAMADEGARLLDRLLQPDFPLLATLETAGALTFAAPAADRHLLVAGHLGRFLIAAVAGQDAAGTLARWRAAALT